MCYNGGINILEEPGLYSNCFGYDIKSFYSNILANEKLDFNFRSKGLQKQFNTIDEIKIYIKLKN